jgi:protein SCO1/2
MLRKSKIRNTMAAAGLLMLLLVGAQAQSLYSGPKTLPPQGKPLAIQNVGIDQHLDQQLPLDLQFRDEAGNQVKLGQYFGTKPIILTLVYYTCPMLCSEVQSGLTSALQILKFDAGKEYDVISVSINPEETPQDALSKKKQFLSRYRREGASAGWHFLTGQKPEIDALAKATGFRYNYDPQTKQYSHATAVMVVTPGGKIAQYFYGIEYAPKDLRLALVQASQNKIGNLTDALLLYCFHYDPTTARYSATVLNIVRLGGLLTVFLMGTFVVINVRREHRV